MNEVIELPDPRNAQAFLSRFPEEAKRKGEACFDSGSVKDLVCQVPAAVFSAQVTDGGTHQVTLRHETEDGWSGECTCPISRNCDHIFAAMEALLTEHRTAIVRRLSAGLPANDQPRPAPAKKETPRSDELAYRLQTSVGRALNREEKAFVRRVHEAYERCRQTRQISVWIFQQMGFSLPLYGWNALQIWPAFPESDYEFWLYVAKTVLDNRGVIPEFMESVTDLSIIEERLARWQRARQIKQWEDTLANTQFQPAAAPPRVEPIDLRFAFHADEIRLEWLRPGRPAFEPVKQAQVRRLVTEYNAGLVSFSTEAGLLWQFLVQRNYAYGMITATSTVEYHDEQILQLLGPLLKMPALESRFVDAQGRPLERPAEPLRWEMTPATSEDEDYGFRLVRADGSPPPQVLCVIPGFPTLYVTPNAVFSGPNPRTSVLSFKEETRIPAPAMERPHGLAFLRSLGIEMPPRVRERIRTLSLQVSIECELVMAGYGGSEECVVRARAEAPDGYQQGWTGDYWHQISGPRASKKANHDPLLPREAKPIIVYDSTALARVPGLLEPLNLKPARFGRGLAVKVTKKFPESFAEWIKSIPPEITLQLKGELASFVSSDVAGHVKLEVSEAEIDWFDLRVVLDVADTTLSPAEIKLLLNAKGRYVRLEGKGWRRLQFDLSDDENDRLARLGLSPRELSAEPQRLHALQLADDAAKKFLPEQQVEQIQRRANELKTRVTPELPSGITAQLRPYQIEGFHFLAYLSANRFGGILADDMGLGKTLQTLAWLLWLRQEQRAGNPDAAAPIPPILVVCPKSVMDNWHAEAAQFIPGLRVRVWSASELDALHECLGSADLHVLNYSQLRMLGENLAKVRWLAVILDEGQYIKNPNSQTAQVARALRAEHRLVLSGTPIENRLMDLWSLMAFAMPGILSSRAQFGRLYDAKDDPYARRRLASRVRPFLLRRTKSQVAKDLPDRIEEDLYCEIEGEQQTLYRAELKRAQQLLLGVKTQKELAQFQFNFLASLLRLRQVCCDPRLINPESTAVSAKSEALMEQLEPLMEEGHKVLVFSQFVEMLNLLRPALAERNWPLFYLAGDTENRGALVREFQAAKGAAVFLISLKAGGFGLNLTAASYVVLFDPWWNPAVEAQAIDRTHRIGQVNKVIAYRLLIKNSIEEKIRVLQKQKKALAEDVLGEEKFAQSLTLQDLQFLFAD